MRRRSLLENRPADSLVLVPLCEVGFISECRRHLFNNAADTSMSCASRAPVPSWRREGAKMVGIFSLRDFRFARRLYGLFRARRIRPVAPGVPTEPNAEDATTALRLGTDFRRHDGLFSIACDGPAGRRFHGRWHRIITHPAQYVRFSLDGHFAAASDTILCRQHRSPRLRCSDIQESEDIGHCVGKGSNDILPRIFPPEFA